MNLTQWRPLHEFQMDDGQYSIAQDIVITPGRDVLVTDPRLLQSYLLISHQLLCIITHHNCYGVALVTVVMSYCNNVHSGFNSASKSLSTVCSRHQEARSLVVCAIIVGAMGLSIDLMDSDSE